VPTVHHTDRRNAEKHFFWFITLCTIRINKQEVTSVDTVEISYVNCRNPSFSFHLRKYLTLATW